MTSAPAGAGALPTDVIRSLSMTITAFGMTRPNPSTSLPALIVVVAPAAGEDNALITTAITQAVMPACTIRHMMISPVATVS